MSDKDNIRIPFCRPDYGDGERAAIETAIRSGKLEGGGAMAVKCERWFEGWAGCERALITPSCTASLEMMALALDLGEGDEIIMPSFTFVSTAGAFALRSAVPVFVDIDPHTFNLDLQAARAAITPKTKAIMLVHYGGVGCDMDGFTALCKEHGIVLLEDAAQAIGATWDGKPLGSFGALSGFSFHHTKNITCGEGGALLINDPALVNTSEIIRDKGTDRSDFLKRQVTKYQWQKLGSSYQLSELASAVLSEQLLRTNEINAARMKIWQKYDEAFAPLNQLQTPHIPAKAGHNAHIYSVLFATSEQR
ncbi:MAG: dTDP-4-amino-4,6-dideoxygalactose transaminase, partial [Robiginitomaculum sp.]|nr:dTDP-4-amino-4,6-dideoxygalactose transaminase [Robiginitomaculum sp.]